MSRIRPLSDLHFEFGPLTVTAGETDVLIVAGDFQTGTRYRDVCLLALAELVAFVKPKLTLVVPGNHEYYDAEPVQLADETLRRQLFARGIVLLQKQTYDFEGVRYYGCTMWSDISTANYIALSKGMNDFNCIKYQDAFGKTQKLFPDDYLVLHKEHRTWLSGALAEPFEGKRVVITHHSPSWRTQDPQYPTDDLDHCYMSNLEPLMDGGSVDLWLFGHQHKAFDQMIGTTRLLSNPRGYRPQDQSNGFNPGLIVEV